MEMMTPPTSPAPEARPPTRPIHGRVPLLRRLLACLLPLLLAWPAAGCAEATAQEPTYAPGRALVGALARYQALARGADLRPPHSTSVVRPDARYPDAPRLRRYLTALGDVQPIPAGTIAPDADTLYAGELVGAVVAFQRRHGLEPDGIIGPATMAEMRVPLDRRVRQIELAIERWNALPDSLPGRLVVVNVPAFRLYAFDSAAPAGRPALAINVIVGRATGGHATPLFDGTMRELVFQPYWDVPLSIARNELVPKIRRDAGYMQRNQMEIVRGGDRGATVFAPTATNLDRVAAGELRLRQRPGAHNSLGGVKFVFPNRYNVFLHGTPEMSLFRRARRDFSHGCIRLEDPAALAGWVLRGQDSWNRDSVDAAMTTGGISRRIQLESPVGVYVIYATAAVEDDGLVRFYPDVYGHDAARVSTATVGAGPGIHDPAAAPSAPRPTASSPR